MRSPRMQTTLSRTKWACCPAPPRCKLSCPDHRCPRSEEASYLGGQGHPSPAASPALAKQVQVVAVVLELKAVPMGDQLLLIPQAWSLDTRAAVWAPKPPSPRADSIAVPGQPLPGPHGATQHLNSGWKLAHRISSAVAHAMPHDACASRSAFKALWMWARWHPEEEGCPAAFSVAAVVWSPRVPGASG